MATHNQVRERRNQLRHPAYAAPELLATGPNQLWSWDITTLKGPRAWTYFYGYVILDVFSRCVVGWMVMERESGLLAEEFIAETRRQEGIGPQQLTLHADNGSSMTSKTVAQLLADLVVTKTHSRPHVSNDNPYSEAQFKTTKYRPDYPDRFVSLDDARQWMRQFVRWSQSRALPQRDWPAAAGRRPSRPDERRDRRPPTGARGRLRGPPGALWARHALSPPVAEAV